jgi:C4-dicarboxylate transporter, DctM subunit
MILLAFILAGVMLAIGFEMFLVIGVAALLIKQTFFANMPEVVLVQKMVGGIDHAVLLAIPFYIFGADLMSEGRLAYLLSRAANACFGRVRGGVGYGTVVSCMMFGSVCGSAQATVAALGRLMFPQLKEAGFRERFSLGLIASSAETALLIPPSITLIIYGWITETSINRLFAAGMVVGIVLGIAFMLFVMYEVWRNDAARETKVSATGEVAKGMGWALGMPLIILGGIYSGFFTATEAAAIGAFYAVFVEAVIFRALTWRKFLAIAQRSAILTSIIFILLAVANIVSFFITLANVADLVLSFMNAINAGPYTLLLLVNIILLIAGCFMDPGTAILILMPAIFPVAVSMGIDPVHLGLVVTLTACTSMITPPFGYDLFVASSLLNKPVTEVTRGSIPFVGINLVMLAIVTYVPGIATFLPNLLFGPS